MQKAGFSHNEAHFGVITATSLGGIKITDTIESGISFEISGKYRIVFFLQKVNYAGIGASSEFERYVRLTKELARVQIAEASREEKLAFFINIYNAQVIHANVTMGPPVSLWQRYKVNA